MKEKPDEVKPDHLLEGLTNLRIEDGPKRSLAAALEPKISDDQDKVDRGATDDSSADSEDEEVSHIAQAIEMGIGKS